MCAAKIYVIDSKQEIGRVLGQFCWEHREFQFAGSAGEIEAALIELSQLQPEIILISLSTQMLDGSAIQQIRKLSPQAHLIAYAFADDAAYRSAASALGIEKFVSTPNLITEIQAWASERA